MALHKVDTVKVIAALLKKLSNMPIPEPGGRGKPGKDGVTKVITETVHVHEKSEPGATGAVPEHEVRNGDIRFKNPDGTWGKWITVQPSGGGGGGGEHVKYTSVRQAVFKVNRGSLIEGTNIFGVNFAGPVEIILPDGIAKNIIIVVKDESNDASTNNITVTKG